MKDALQQQFVVARRHQILDAAARVFAEKGFHPTTIRDIARAAGLADGTIYNYFDNKTALLLAIFERMKEAVQQDAAVTLLTDTTDVRGFLKTYLRHPLSILKQDNFALFRIIVSEMMVNSELRTLYYQQVLEPTLSLMETRFQQWVDQQLIQPTNIGLTLRVLSSLMLGLMVQHVMGDPTLEAQWETLPDFITDLLLDGVGNEPS